MEKEEKHNSRRDFFKKLPVLAAGTAALAGCNSAELEDFFQQNFRTLTKAEKNDISAIVDFMKDYYYIEKNKTGWWCCTQV